jgi:hypothetical protein
MRDVEVEEAHAKFSQVEAEAKARLVDANAKSRILEAQVKVMAEDNRSPTWTTSGDGLFICSPHRSQQ